MTKKLTVATALLLMFTMAFSIVPLATVNAHDPPWSIPTYSYMAVSPNPVGLGQVVYVNFWVDEPPPTANNIWGDRWENMTVIVTLPDGNKQTLGHFRSDNTGGTHTDYSPSVVGNYTFEFIFPGQVLTGDNPPSNGYSSSVAAFIGDYYEPSSAVRR